MTTEQEHQKEVDRQLKTYNSMMELARNSDSQSFDNNFKDPTAHYQLIIWAVIVVLVLILASVCQ